MPRQTAEAKLGANLRSGLRRWNAPTHLNDEAKAEWRKIVSSRPVDFFHESHLPLLEAYCRTLVLLRKATDVLEGIDATEVGEFGEQSKTVVRLNGSAIVIATKLRLTIQTAIRGDAGINNEREEPRSPLLGGNVTRLRAS